MAKQSTNAELLSAQLSQDGIVEAFRAFAGGAVFGGAAVPRRMSGSSGQD